MISRMNKINRKETNRLANRLKSRGYSRSAELEYQRKLLRIIKTIKKDFANAVDEALKSPDYIHDSAIDDLKRALERLTSQYQSLAFEVFANRYAKEFVEKIEKFASKPFAPLALDVFSAPKIKAIIRNSVEANVQLIKSLAQDECNALSNIIYSNVQSGYRSSQIIELIKAHGVGDRRAKVIARDQTSKVHGAIARERMTSAGFEYFRWATSKDERVRPSHREVANRKTKYGIGVYRFDDPPVVDGVKALPSQPIMCRCVAIPVDEEDVEAFQSGAR